VDGQVFGNVRSVITPDTDGKPIVVQANDYFPFGMSFESPIPNLSYKSTTTNKHKYNGKEEQEMPGKWLDYGARFYDAQLGRWHGVDPLAEKYFSTTPYSYVESNPIVFIDPNGEDKVIAIVYNQRRSKDKSLWAVEIAYDIDKGQGTYKGMIKGGNYSGNFQGKFNSDKKSNYLNANLFTKEGAVGLYHQYQNGEQDYGLTDANSQDFSFDQRWTEEGTKIPTSIATGIADAFDILNDVSIGDLPLGEAGADAVNEKFKDFNGTVEYINGKDGNHSFRFTVNGTDISFKIDYIITEDEK
jgi:RHS repeat-associated protein